MTRLTDVQRRELEALGRAYKKELSDKLAAMEASSATLVRDGWDRAIVESLYQQAHRIAGSSGVYGLPALTRAAGILEELLKELLAAPTWPPARPPAELATIVRAVRRAGRAAGR